jgi:hypothetical protein
MLAAPALDGHTLHMARFSKNKLTGFLTVLLAWFSMAGWAAAAEVATESLDQKIDAWFGKITKPFVDLIFFKINIGGFEAFAIIFWLAAAGVIITLAFRFINLRSFALALRTVRGKYS